MKDLVALLEKNQYCNVRSYIQSGNLVLDTKAGANKKPDQDIGAMVEKRFGFRPEIICLSLAEFKRIVANNPYPAAKGNAMHFFICKDTPQADIDKLEQLKTGSESYQIFGKVLYLHAPDGIGRSKLAAKVETCLGVAVTARNLNTIMQLQKMILPQP